MLRLLRSELYRLVRRWMPWIMLGIIVLAEFAIYFLIWGSTEAQIQAIRSGQIQLQPGQTVEQLQETLLLVTPQRVQDFGVGLVSGFGSVMLIVFAAGHMGSEFGWGTFRTLLAHGASRSGFLLSKTTSLLLYTVVFTIVGTVAAIAASFAVSSVAGLSVGSVDFSEVARVAGKSAYTFLPYMALAVMVAVLAKAAGAGIAAGLVVYLAEGLVATLLVSLNKDYAQIVNWGLSRNASALTRTAEGPSTQDPTALTLPDPTQAAIVLGVYTVIFIAIAYWRLRSRDVTVGG